MIPFIDLHAQQKLIRKRIDKRIKQVLDHGQYILGPEVKELEDRLSSFTGAKYTLCCSSGTDALLLSLLGLKIKPGMVLLYLLSLSLRLLRLCLCLVLFQFSWMLSVIPSI